MKKESFISRYLYLLLVLALVFSLISTIILISRKDKVLETREILKEQLRPANLQIIKIVHPDCDDCWDINEALEDLKKQSINITSEESLDYNSEKTKELIKKYSIRKLPALIIMGEINKSEQLVRYLSDRGDISNNVVVYASIKPPYYDETLSKVVGKVSVINLLDYSCKECENLIPVVNSLKEAGVTITDEEHIEYSSEEGKRLIKEFYIRQVPAILVSDEINYYDAIRQELSKLNLTLKKGFYAIHSLAPPYRDIEKNKIVGIVDIILLSDDSCSNCYDVNINRMILKRRGIIIKTEKLYDINSREGMELKAKYSITKVPVLIMSPEANAYPSLVISWQGVGTVEKDGWFVMRDPSGLGTYQNLETGNVVEVDNQNG